MDEVVISELLNWSEAGFKSPVRIWFIKELRSSGKPYISRDVDAYGLTYHSSISAAKAAIRSENSTRHSPRFKWKDKEHP